jgi:hypothetical protein
MAWDSNGAWEREQETLVASTVWILSKGMHVSMQSGKR